MLIVHKPFNQSLVNLTVKMSDDVECSVAFDDSCGRANSCIRSYVLITKGEEELYNEYGLPQEKIKVILAMALLDNLGGIELVVAS